MQLFSILDEVACVLTGITARNPAMVARLRRQAKAMPPAEIAAHLANAIASATDAAHARAWEEAEHGMASAETLVDHEYYGELVAAWSLVAGEHQITSLDPWLGERDRLH
ncbi:hypothetical protein J2792_002791 [Novosphingobium capsulatum]|jgi:hypothetical protein|uniref:Uncharacterized protein n=1 Tax=Novosphingobium capsulatum TaxID=13688 RepID=A0ABU1MNI4_9SPHN|nr:hypothetical protein [Novosphingobium capsulatum]MDR6511908.1 hypothetical protein [Novosphingobium capsulatum]